MPSHLGYTILLIRDMTIRTLYLNSYYLFPSFRLAGTNWPFGLSQAPIFCSFWLGDHPNYERLTLRICKPCFIADVILMGKDLEDGDDNDVSHPAMVRIIY